ncbi:MAG: hypothetical protein O2887_12205 [Bacteroidetes bacterium]|nr:hypothetical protein [Bacteroidota bacterium]MDA1121234.1 hypothetical protein [Bacteroidota bacterium]
MKNPIYFLGLPLIIISCSTPFSDNAASKAASDLIAPEEVGLISDSLNLIDSHIQWAIDSQFIAGGVALVARDNKITCCVN